MVNKLCLVLVVLLLCSCIGGTSKYEGECDLRNTWNVNRITFKNISGVNKLDKIVFSECDSITERYEFKPLILPKNRKDDYELRINDDLALMLMRGCVITINDSIIHKISDINVGIVTNHTMVSKIEMCELVEYKRNDSIKNGHNGIVVPF